MILLVKLLFVVSRFSVILTGDICNCIIAWGGLNPSEVNGNVVEQNVGMEQLGQILVIRLINFR